MYTSRIGHFAHEYLNPAAYWIHVYSYKYKLQFFNTMKTLQFFNLLQIFKKIPKNIFQVNEHYYTTKWMWKLYRISVSQQRTIVTAQMFGKSRYTSATVLRHSLYASLRNKIRIHLNNGDY